MNLKDTANTLMRQLECCVRDLHKANKGNRAAAQRVRTGTIKLEKCAKMYRKESVAAEKKGLFKKPRKTSAKKSKKRR